MRVVSLDAADGLPEKKGAGMLDALVAGRWLLKIPLVEQCVWIDEHRANLSFNAGRQYLHDLEKKNSNILDSRPPALPCTINPILTRKRVE
jgi:hypothetical protein